MCPALGGHHPGAAPFRTPSCFPLPCCSLCPARSLGYHAHRQQLRPAPEDIADSSVASFGAINPRLARKATTGEPWRVADPEIQGGHACAHPIRLSLVNWFAFTTEPGPSWTCR